jgi:hypothetical protein
MCRRLAGRSTTPTSSAAAAASASLPAGGGGGGGLLVLAYELPGALGARLVGDRYAPVPKRGPQKPTAGPWQLRALAFAPRTHTPAAAGAAAPASERPLATLLLLESSRQVCGRACIRARMRSPPASPAPASPSPPPPCRVLRSSHAGSSGPREQGQHQVRALTRRRRSASLTRLLRRPRPRLRWPPCPCRCRCLGPPWRR